VVPPWSVSGRDENGKEGWNGHLYCLKIVYTEREREREREREGWMMMASICSTILFLLFHLSTVL
jgi:hypothetical protein